MGQQSTIRGASGIYGQQFLSEVTLENQGYCFEHNYGHGKKNLSTVFAFLMMLAFLQIQQRCLFQQVQMKAKRPSYF